MYAYRIDPPQTPGEVAGTSQSPSPPIAGRAVLMYQTCSFFWQGAEAEGPFANSSLSVAQEWRNM